MTKPKLIRITTVPVSLEKLLEGQLVFMQQHFTVIAVSSQREKLNAFGKKYNINTHYIPFTRKITPFQDIISVWKLYLFLKKEKPQLVHTHTPKAGIVGMIAAYFARVPHRLHTVAGLPLLEATGLKRKLLNLVEKATYRFATKVYPNSKGLQQIILSQQFTTPNKLSIIANGSSNGIDTHYFSTSHFSQKQLREKKQELAITTNDFIFIFVGRLVADKGINELVAAFTNSSIHTQSTLLLVGDFEEQLDPLQPHTKKLINSHPKIIATGWQDDVRLFFALSDALVFPSYREGFPNVVLQAGAMELPAIVSNINGCNEIITHKQNGLVIPVKDIAKLQQAMETLLSNSTLYQQLKKHTLDNICQKYERQQVWDALLDEYTILLNKKP